VSFDNNVPCSCSLDPFKPYIIFSNRHEIRRIDLYKGEFSVLVPGLRNTIALDFHLNQSSLYWTDVVEDKIYRGKLSESGGKWKSYKCLWGVVVPKLMVFFCCCLEFVYSRRTLLLNGFREKWTSITFSCFTHLFKVLSWLCCLAVCFPTLSCFFF